MNEAQLFFNTRWRLASWYAGVMGVILTISGFGVYEAIDHAHRTTADRELQVIAGQLHDNLEPLLLIPGNMPTAAQKYLPESCDDLSQCTNSPRITATHSPGELFQSNYYINLLNPTGQPIVSSGFRAQDLSMPSSTVEWQFLHDRDNIRYRQITIPLHIKSGVLWGYLQVGSSLKDFDRYLSSVRLTLIASLPLSLGFIGIASWWLAGKAIQPIRHAYQQMQQFTADAAHELRTPIAAAQATVESVLDTPNLSVNDTREILRVLDRQHLRLSQLIQDLLFLSRLDRHIQTGTQQSSCLQDILNDIAEELAALAINHKIKLLTDIQVNHLLWVTGDESQLYRLVFNLAINAIQHTPKGGTVTLILKDNDKQAVIQVIDTGVGIADEHQSKIFDRFYRVVSDRNRQDGGSGLGLAIVKAIAQTYNGNISVKSRLNQGSTFTVNLPMTSYEMDLES